MANKNIEESLEEAKNYINNLEGEADINIADRILNSCKSFLHQPHTKEFDDYDKKITTELEQKLDEAKEKNDKEKDSFMKYYNMAQYYITLRLEKTQRMINYLDALNKKL